MIEYIDKNGTPVAAGDRVRVSHNPYYSGDASRYRSQSYGEGVILAGNVAVAHHGVYIQVDGAPDQTWTTCAYRWQSGKYQLTDVLKLT